jgi:hypothetical protein
MSIIKIILLALFIASGGTVAHPKVREFLGRHPIINTLAIGMAALAALYLVFGIFMDIDSFIKWAYHRVTIGPYLDRRYSIAECDKGLTDKCVRYGGIFGDRNSLEKIKNCEHMKILSSSDQAMNWTNLWITNIYSYAPGGGGPGGGLINDVLKVGGWGDWYFSLIKFNLPNERDEASFAAILLFVRDSEHETVPVFVDRIIERWKWDLTQHIWWRDRPGSFPIVTDSLPAPEKTHWYVVEITKLYNQWINRSAENFGVQIRPATNYGSFIEFTSSKAPDRTKAPSLLVCRR